MPAKKHLKKEQKEKLQKALKEEEHPEIRERILILLLLNDGKNTADFAKEGAKIVIILDNASFHKKEEVIQKIESEMPNIQLEFLPEYSPDYNLIELYHFSKSVREMIS